MVAPAELGSTRSLEPECSIFQRMLPLISVAVKSGKSPPHAAPLSFCAKTAEPQASRRHAMATNRTATANFIESPTYEIAEPTAVVPHIRASGGSTANARLP